MISIKNILTISKYEAKVLWRNWFFRIIAIAGLLFVTFFNIIAFSEADTPRWMQLSNSWLMPYSTLVLISIPQVAAVIFLATGLIKKDKKVDTNEVFFVRPISNLDYVLGKALALFKLFFTLNFVLLCIPMIVNFTSPMTTFNPMAFVVYPLLTSIPTIVFTTGIAFLIVTLLKNQPITIVLLIGVAGVQVIYFFDQFSNIFDFSAFRLQMLASEISGFVELEFALWQRLFYFITGIAFLFATAFFLDRLASHRRVKIATGLISMTFIGITSYMMFNLWSLRQEPIDLRKEMVAVNGEYAEIPNITLVSNYIDLELKGKEIISTSDMVVKNNSDKTLPKIYFTLNPELTVDQVLINNKTQEFNRHIQMVIVEKGINLSPSQDMKVQIKYHGSITQAAAHLEVAQDRYEDAVDYFMYSLQKKYAFLQPDYVLLTKEVLWYPDTQVGYNLKSTSKNRHSLIDFQLNVKTPDGLVAISQGELKESQNTYQFRPEYSLPQISLVIGKYVKTKIVVDSISYELYHYKKNDHFAKQLDQLTDTLDYLIKDIVNEYEDEQKLTYPFKRLQFVETPLQFVAYNKIYESHQAFLQPETVFWPEQGGDIRQFDFRRQMRDMNRQSKAKNQTLTEKQKQANVFNDLIKGVFTKQIQSGWFFDGREDDAQDYSLFPNYYTFSTGIVSNEWALLNRSIATYLSGNNQTKTDYSRNINGISFTEECNQLMRDSTLTAILTETDFNKIQKSVELKSQYLFSYIGQLVGESNFKNFLHQWINANQHQLTSYDDFRSAAHTQLGLDIDPIIQQVYFETSQPAFEILEVQIYEMLDGDRKRYQVLVKIKNSGENDGVVDIKIKSGDPSNDRDFRRREIAEEQEDLPNQLAVIKKGNIKQIGFVLDKKPSEVIVNTIISRNIPSEITMSVGVINKRKNEELFTGERLITEETTKSQYEAIVDNEDPEFSTFSPVKPTYLRAYLDGRSEVEKKYHGSWYRSYSKWLATTGSDFYGNVVRSAYFTRSGSGDKTATWSPNLKEEGFYDIYLYMKGKNQNEFQGRDSDNRQFNYHYAINHADGTDNVKYNLSNAEPGWNYLGAYYFNQTGGSIVLTDECELRTVYADAIKWVKQ